ncbi:MAG: hypothetical protein HQK55_00900 [Deltaproteobacteria bacterium]|nr:hypothetical protein [Deltaproteobacteria bacterium]
MEILHCSGEITFLVDDKLMMLERIFGYFVPYTPRIDCNDGLSMEFENWRFNLQLSKTESSVCLKVESRVNLNSVWRHVEELQRLIGSRKFELGESNILKTLNSS